MLEKYIDNKQQTSFHGQKMERQKKKKRKSERTKEEIEEERRKDGAYKEWRKNETMLCDPRGQNERFMKMVAEGQWPVCFLAGQKRGNKRILSLSRLGFFWFLRMKG